GQARPGPRAARAAGGVAVWPTLRLHRPRNVVGGVAASLAGRYEKALGDQIGELAPGRGTAGAGQGHVFASADAAGKALRAGVEQPVQDLALPLVDLGGLKAQPVARLGERAGEGGMGLGGGILHLL